MFSFSVIKLWNIQKMGLAVCFINDKARLHYIYRCWCQLRHWQP
ncbi:hypothetical protein HMPREF0758_4892 [Serratia odorifera DSM 4582]|uniref:Uncharacterized protein n=1 Tax=Serratia odorifera DSM 4582 TaxID=667129 RepID=D4E9P2_SEROD|nr:hypothetical protein HMPREF0758_4892 [Serratia odorifera DSM 4582]